MDLDDQLAALAAGELDADEARALQARVGSDPALQRRLARIERLDQVLAGWEAPPLSDEATARIDASITEALDALPDGPLVTGDATAAPRLRALPDDPQHDAAPAAVGRADRTADTGEAHDVVDLTEVRARRADGGVPRWLAGLGIAAAAVAVVGTAGQLMGSSDEASPDVLAGDSAADMAEESMPEASIAAGPMLLEGVTYDESNLDTLAALVPSELAFTDDGAATGMADSGPAQDGGSTSVQPPEEGQGTTGGTTSEGSDDLAPSADSERATTAACLDGALSTGLGQPVLLASGSYAGAPALFVVLHSTDVAQDGQGSTLTTFVYAPSDCSLLATRTVTR